MKNYIYYGSRFTWTHFGFRLKSFNPADIGEKDCYCCGGEKGDNGWHMCYECRGIPQELVEERRDLIQAYGPQSLLQIGTPVIRYDQGGRVEKERQKFMEIQSFLHRLYCFRSAQRSVYLESHE